MVSYSICAFNVQVDFVISYRVNCPNCGKELAKPDKKLENAVFCVARYTCDACGTTFKYSKEF
jgi:transposase-like protein